MDKANAKPDTDFTHILTFYNNSDSEKLNLFFSIEMKPPVKNNVRFLRCEPVKNNTRFNQEPVKNSTGFAKL